MLYLLIRIACKRRLIRQNLRKLIYNQNVTNEYTRITDISSKYQSLWEDYCKYAEAASKLGDNPTDEQLHELDILLVQMQKEYKRLDMVFVTF